MNKRESSVCYLFKDCFSLEWMRTAPIGTLSGIETFLSIILEQIKDEIKKGVVLNE